MDGKCCSKSLLSSGNSYTLLGLHGGQWYDQKEYALKRKAGWIQSDGISCLNLKVGFPIWVRERNTKMAETFRGCSETLLFSLL